MHGLSADRMWYLLLVQAYLEQSRAWRWGMVSRGSGDEWLESKDSQ